MKSPKQSHGSSVYNYGTGRMSKSERPGRKAEMPMKGAMQRRVMPGDAHAAMKAGKAC